MNPKCSWQNFDLCLIFSVFPPMFELTRKTAIAVKSVVAPHLVQRGGLKAENSILSCIIHGSVFVSGGILASVPFGPVGRPFDAVGRPGCLPSSYFASNRY